MTTDSNETAGSTTVRDGTTTPGNPIPRDTEPPGREYVAPEIAVDPPADSGEDAADAGQSESSGPPGPAEEKDNATADHRGLTTETNPTD
ncbi:hypothetical protein OHC50_12725 [Paenarthrobacter ilicis]|uniref:hypothetical protein n=1 Tax=Paenarthrobacter ilicis TaxID=43665 RepID=UPI0030094A5E